MLWVAATAVVWLGLLAAIIAMCRAAAAGDAFQEAHHPDRLGRFSHGAPPLVARRRSRAG
jgi:hypothetical protein